MSTEKLQDMRTIDFDLARVSKEVLAIMCEEWKRQARALFSLADRDDNEKSKRSTELIGHAYLNCAKDLEYHLRLNREPAYLDDWRTGKVLPTTGLLTT